MLNWILHLSLIYGNGLYTFLCKVTQLAAQIQQI